MRTASRPMRVLALAAAACLRAPPRRAPAPGIDARTPCVGRAVAWRVPGRGDYREFARPLATLALAQHDPYVQATLLESFVAFADRARRPRQVLRRRALSEPRSRGSAPRRARVCWRGRHA